jgi:hypothetical protein
LAYKLAQGDSWSQPSFLKKVLQYATGDKMDKAFERIKAIRFEPTTVEMKDLKTIDTYFGGSPIEFRDYSNKSHKATYYQSLEMIIKDLSGDKEVIKKRWGKSVTINSKKTLLEDVLDKLGEKWDKTQMNRSFAELSQTDQQVVKIKIQSVSEVIKIISNFTVFILKDMKTIQNSIGSVNKKREKLEKQPIKKKK